MWWITRRFSSVEDIREPSGWLSSDILSRGCPLALYTLPWGVTCGYDNNASLSNSKPTESIFL
jgi:hypothetical protein